MISFPYMTLFYSTLILGTIFSLSGTHWIFIWMGMELNLLSFIPLMTFSFTHQEAEGAMKYFLAQVVGSGLILLSIFTILSPLLLFIKMNISFILLLGILLKCGLPPCHFWYPAVMALISWPMCMILSTWQKITPLSILLYFIYLPSNFMLMLFIMLISLIGGIGGLTQSQLRPLLAYSSIGHMSWMLAASIKSFLISFFYFISYMIMTLTLMMIFWIQNFYSSYSTNNMYKNSIYMFSLMITLMSLGGIPPFFGFFPKWMVITILNTSLMMLVYILMIGSMINLYYYMNILFIKFLEKQKYLSYNKYNKNKLYILLLISTSSLLISYIFMLI
uniref:NADH-ubiquinone oxidoreductase chain 2 n=1 Tax=Gesiella jameensis TaxID=1960709 RepID=A0A8E7IUU7_9ANNE|nr:NADH dehydrogenase subunit 2 [Gesiella jameensis]